MHYKEATSCHHDSYPHLAKSCGQKLNYQTLKSDRNWQSLIVITNTLQAYSHRSDTCFEYTQREVKREVMECVPCDGYYCLTNRQQSTVQLLTHKPMPTYTTQVLLLPNWPSCWQTYQEESGRRFSRCFPSDLAVHSPWNIFHELPLTWRVYTEDNKLFIVKYLQKTCKNYNKHKLTIYKAFRRRKTDSSVQLRWFHWLCSSFYNTSAHCEKTLKQNCGVFFFHFINL